jgi:hypothetical protein
MEESENPTKRQVALRKGAAETGIMGELIPLLEAVTAHGRITDSEAARLRVWLEANRDAGLPAIDFLRTTLERTAIDGTISAEERKSLYKAVERVLPPELRDKAKSRRLAAKLQEKADEREKKAALRARASEERERNRRVYSANFMVAGTSYEGRSELIETDLRPGQALYLVRDPHNKHDKNAVEICLANGRGIGYVPREDAREMAPFLDKGFTHAANCTKILTGGTRPIPVVQVDLYRADATIPNAMVTSNALKRAWEKPIGSSLATNLLLGFAAIAILVIILLGLYAAIH